MLGRGLGQHTIPPMAVQLNDFVHHRNICIAALLGLSDEIGVASFACSKRKVMVI